jgi:transposase-like protein
MSSSPNPYGTMTCPTCGGKGTIVKDGPHPDEYDNQYPCQTCTTSRTALRGTGLVADMSVDA